MVYLQRYAVQARCILLYYTNLFIIHSLIFNILYINERYSIDEKQTFVTVKLNNIEYLFSIYNVFTLGYLL